MYVDAADARGRAILAAGGVLHPQASRLWESVLAARQWDFIVDVGANYGEMLLATHIDRESRVVAVEPNSRVLATLARTLSEAHPQAVICSSAVASENATVTFYDDLTWWGNSTLCGSWTADRPHKWVETAVNTVRLSTLLRDLGAGPTTTLALKLDIEGAESAVLRDSLDVLRRLRACALLVEIVRMAESDLLWLLRNFRVEVLDIPTGGVIPLADLSGFANPLDALFSPSVYNRDVVAVPIS